ncbi:magnesium-dependent phosphatase 1 [Parasteatoda tepidariorum]|uniref:magnesium-dependent phosphatase 1 n=1 Tax=Parasteatoda tepidariorum TaxID=114398 RepID=UPI001C71B2C3|nr:magnesium-dependent phosphatase 1 [Parasteatoda tepidariorum]
MPLTKDKHNQIVDGSGQKVKCYPDVPEVLKKLKNDGYLLGIASRTEWPAGARELLKLFDWNKFFTFQEIYPGKKTTHFQKIKKDSGVDYSEMLFFDDEDRNIHDLNAIGVKSILVTDGVTQKLVDDALKNFENS